MSKLPRDFDFLDRICPKRVLSVQNRKGEHHHGILHVQIICDTKFQFRLKILKFKSHLTKKGISNRKQKSEHHHWILHTWISLGAKFLPKLKILIFWTKFTQKRCFQSKTKKVNITVKFCIFELVLVPNFSLNRQFPVLGPNLPEKVFLVESGRNEYHHWILHIRIRLATKFQPKLTISIFSDQICPKTVSGRKQEKWTPPLNSAYLN